MKKIGLFLILILTISQSWALEFKETYIRLMPPSAASSAAFMKIENPSDQPVSLIKAESDIAAAVELHTHLKENGMLAMREVKEIVIPAKGSVELKPGGHHIMLINLKRDLVKDEKIKVILHFSDKTKTELAVPVTAFH